MSSFVGSVCLFALSASLSSIHVFAAPDCDDAFSCVNDTIVEFDEEIDCRGFVSCYLSNISDIISDDVSDSREVTCEGSRSCQNTSSFRSVSTSSQDSEITIEASGFLSLSYSEFVEITNDEYPDTATLQCLGEASCYGIESLHVYEIECAGGRSCNNIKSGKVAILKGHGSFSLLNSNFYSFVSDSSNADSNITVELYGFYAGFGGSFYCESGYSCSVDCDGTGCTNFNYYCSNDATSCEVSCKGKNTACPNGWKDGSYTGNFDNSYDLSSLNFSYLGTSYVDTFITKIYSSDINYELDNECPNNEDIENEVDCNFGDYLGCYGSNLVFEDTSICANGRSTFVSSEISMTLSDNVTMGANLNSTMDDSNYAIYCNAFRACQATMDFDNEYDVYCRGTSCAKTISNFNAMIASAEDSISYGTVRNGNELVCLGSDSCQGSNLLNIGNIYALGYQSLVFTDIYSNGSDINVYLIGYESGLLTEIICNGNDICNIYGWDANYGDLYKAECDEMDSCTINYIALNESIGFRNNPMFKSILLSVCLIMFALFGM